MSVNASPLPDRLCLPLRFDAARMLGDVSRIEAGYWTPHFNRDEYTGAWDGVALLAREGDAARLYPSRDDEAGCRPTPVLERCPYLTEVLAAFGCRLVSARLLRLAPGARIHEHRDYDLGPDCGRLRLHIPIQTGEDVRFIVGGQRVRMSAGETWYMDFGLLHRVENRGSVDRVHLVVDCINDDWLQNLMTQALAMKTPDDAGAAEADEPDTIEMFRRRLAADPILAGPLEGCADAREFVDLAEAAANRAGLRVERADIELILRSAGRGGSLLELDEAPHLQDWVPESVSWTGGRARVHWCFLGRTPLFDPFFKDTTTRARRAPFNRFMRVVTSIEALEQAARDRPGLPLVGIVAHVSRCGSTLVAQMLATLKSLVVASEPPALDDVLRLGDGHVARERRIDLVRAMVSALGRARTGGETGFVMKLDSWHLASLDVLQDAFPQVPVVLAYRDPAEVLASQMREPGLQMAGGLGEPYGGVSMEGRTQLEYRGKIVGLLFEAALRQGPGCLLINHSELPAAVLSRVAPHFGLALSPADEEKMRSRGALDGKSAQQIFEPRATSPALAEEVGACARQWAAVPYRALEELRKRAHRQDRPIAEAEKAGYATRIVPN